MSQVIVRAFKSAEDRDNQNMSNSIVLDSTTDPHELGRIINSRPADHRYLDYYSGIRRLSGQTEAMELVGARFDEFDEQYYDFNGNPIYF